MRVPRLHRRSLVRRRERREHDVARVDVGQVALDDLRLLPDGRAAEVAPHRVDRLEAGRLDEHGGARPVLVCERRPGEVDPAHRPRLQRMEQEFVALGHAGSDAYAGLETFPNPGVERVEMVSDELTAFCPITHQPDFYTATIEYEPGRPLPRVEVAEDLPLALPRPGRVLRGAGRPDPRRGRRGARARPRPRARDAPPEGARRDHDHRFRVRNKWAARPIVRRPRVVDDRTSDPPSCGSSYSASWLRSPCPPMRSRMCASRRSTTRGTARRPPTARTSTGRRTVTRRRTTSPRRTTPRSASTRRPTSS